MAVRPASALGLLELDAVAERVAGVEPADAGDLSVGRDALAPGCGQRRREKVEVVDQQGRVRLARGRERRLHPQVQDGGAGTEPAAAPRGQDRRLRQLAHPEQARVEGSRRVLTPGRHRYLDMVESCDHRTSKYLDTKIVHIKLDID